MPAFGFAVGDFIASAELLCSVIKSLRETDGAAFEFQQLQTELAFLSNVLSELKILDNVIPNATSAQKASAAKFVQGSWSRLSALFDKVGKFEKYLGESASKGKLPTAAMKARWALFHSHDVTNLHQKIAEQLSNLNLYLEMQQIKEIKALASDNQQALQSIISSLKEQQSRKDTEAERAILVEALLSATTKLEQVSKDICSCNAGLGPQTARNQPPQLLQSTYAVHGDDMSAEACPHSGSQSAIKHYTKIDKPLNQLTTRLAILVADLVESIIVGLWVLLWEFLRRAFLRFQTLQHPAMRFEIPVSHISRCIRFFDALGGSHVLEYNMFRDWQVFEVHLRKQFFNAPGYKKVQRGEYVLLNLQTKEAIPKNETWQELVFPGSKVGMSIVITELEIKDRRCPRPNCDGNLSLPAGLQPLRSQCPKCSLVLDPMLPSLEPDDAVRAHESKKQKNRDQHAHRTNRTRAMRRKEKSERDEISIYSRVCIREAVLPSETSLVKPAPKTAIRLKSNGYLDTQPKVISGGPVVPLDMWICCECAGGNLVELSGAQCPVCFHGQCQRCSGPGECYDVFS